jgi:hypothetical protein
VVDDDVGSRGGSTVTHARYAPLEAKPDKAEEWATPPQIHELDVIASNLRARSDAAVAASGRAPRGCLA